MLYEKCRDCNIYKIDVMGIAIIKPNGEVSQKDIIDPNVEDFWFITKMFNDGKCGGKHINHSGRRFNHLTKTWYKSDETSDYLIHYQFEKYHHAVVWGDWYQCYGYLFHKFQDGEIVLSTPPHIAQPNLGPKNAIKIKTAVRKYLERVRNG